LSTFFSSSQGWLWFGYEAVGLENIPAEGGALIIYYHGAFPVDYYYFVAKVLLHSPNRMIHSVVDNFLFKLPGLKSLLKAYECTPGSVDGCTEELKQGHLLGEERLCNSFYMGDSLHKGPCPLAS
jgi:hypothetical protein